ncbi:MAG TPA: hypothetical protein VGL59_03755 [Polyangia bacterium]|jgi:hypothetical protein
MATPEGLRILTRAGRVRPPGESGDRLNRRGKLAKKYWWLGPLLVFGCGNLPDGQLLTSAHFRYHARADAVLDPTIMDRLETHRAEFDAHFGVDPGVVDYYLFRDEADQRANVSCQGRQCTEERSVMAWDPFQEHELVHAFLHDTGLAAPVVAEGIAQYASCLVPRFAPFINSQQWPAAVGSGSTGIDQPGLSTYSLGQRLVSWMIATGGTQRFLRFYGQSVPTFDASLFVLQFQRFWGRHFGDVVDELPDQAFAGSSCPCMAPALPADGSPAAFVSLQDYRTLDVAQESRLELSSNQGQLVFPYSCANAADLGPQVGAADAPGGPSLTIARVGPGRYGVTTALSSTGTAIVSQNQRAADDWTCEGAAANPVALAGRSATAWVTADRNGPTWFAFILDGPALLDVLSEGTDFLLCPTCHESGLGNASCIGPQNVLDPTKPIPVARPSSGAVVIALMSGPAVSSTSVGVRLRPAP